MHDDELPDEKLDDKLREEVDAQYGPLNLWVGVTVFLVGLVVVFLISLWLR